MSEGTPTKETQAAKRNIAPFTVEIGDRKNSPLIRMNHLRLWLRGNWDKAKYGTTTYMPRDGIGECGAMPVIPGIRLEVNPRAGTVKIFDPLGDPANKDLVEQIENVLKGSADYVTIREVGSEKVRAWPTAEHELDDDMMKSLLLEIARNVHGPVEHRVFTAMAGSRVPTVKELDDFPGDELYDPWSSNPDRPVYVKDAKVWRQKMQQREPVL